MKSSQNLSIRKQTSLRYHSTSLRMKITQAHTHKLAAGDAKQYRIDTLAISCKIEHAFSIQYGRSILFFFF